MRVYLGGPVNACTDAEAKGWRDEVKRALEQYGHEWVDPMDRDYRGREMEPGIAAEVVELDKADIDRCDLLFMNCSRPSVGTSMEVMYGWQQDKKVICVVPAGSTPSPWLVYHADAVRFGSVTDALRSVR